MSSRRGPIRPDEDKEREREEGLYANSGEEDMEVNKKHSDDTKEITEEDERKSVDGEEYKCVECGEAEVPRAVRSPKRPTAKEVEDHELTHCPPRSWCEHCVRGQAKDDQHRTITGPAAESSVTRVTMDYCYLTEKSKGKADNEDESTEAKDSMTVMVMKEDMCNSVWAYAVESKGAGEQWMIEQIVEDFETIGLTEERIIIKTDQEASITDVQNGIVKARAGHGTAMEHSRVGDSNSNGRAERAIQDVKGLVRTLRSAVEEKIGERISLDHPLVPWMVRHAGHTITRCRIRENGRTAYQIMKGRRSTAKLVPFAEAVLFKTPKTKQMPGDFEDRWETGVWVGFVMRSGEHLVATSRGVFRVSTVMRRTADKRWSAELLRNIKGSPKDPVPEAGIGRRIPAFAKKFEDNKDKVVYIPTPEK